MKFTTLFRCGAFCTLLRPLVAPAADDTEAAYAAADGKKPVRLDEVEVSTTRTSALTQAPAEGRLEALQPQSVIDIQTISNVIAPSADYTMIANLSPSVSSVQSNGPGLNEAKNILRGFADGQYNVTYDGIHFWDTNSFTHHSTGYFPSPSSTSMVAGSSCVRSMSAATRSTGFV